MNSGNSGPLSLTSFSVGAVTLNVKHLDSTAAFYRDVLGLELIRQNDSESVFGKHGSALVRLLHAADLPEAETGHAGLYHFAIVFSSRKELSQSIQNILKKTPHLFSGSADHLVSEAFYFTDPEGNGIELYYDRDRTSWLWDNGRVRMASVYIDPADYIRRYIVLEENDSVIRMGHLHLKVGDVGEAKKFYADTLGFDVTAELPGAIFVSFGGYHHHIGMNSWESYGAEERDNTLGLASLEFILSDPKEIMTLKKRLTLHKIPVTEHGTSFTFSDPWKNLIRVSESHGIR